MTPPTPLDRAAALSPRLTNSRLGTLQRCPREHLYRYEEGWMPVGTGGFAARFGSLVHYALERVFLGKSIILEDGLTSRIWREWQARLELEDVDVVKAQELVRGYVDFYSPIPFGDVVAVEEKFECGLPHPDDWTTAHPVFDLAGKVDLLLKADDSSNRVWIVDHKTTSDTLDDDSSPIFRRLLLDTQPTVYHLGVSAMGFEPVGWIHDLIRKPRSAPLLATPPEKRKYCKTGPRKGKLHANQRETDETLYEYRLRLREEIASSPSSFYRRIEIYRDVEELTAFLRDAWGEIERLSLEARPRATSNCLRFGGSACAYHAACSTHTHPEMHASLYQRKDDVHPELADEAPSPAELEADAAATTSSTNQETNQNQQPEQQHQTT